MRLFSSLARPLALLLLYASVLATPGLARAQEPTSAGRGDAAQRQAQRAADVALLLRLTPSQQGAYQAMEAGLRPPASAEEGSPPDRETRMRAREEAMGRFAATLTPEQRPLFEALMRLRREGGGRGRWGGDNRAGPPSI